MLTQADDEGRLVADLGHLRLVAFGYDQDVTDAKVAELLAEVAATGIVRCYEVRASLVTARAGRCRCLPVRWNPAGTTPVEPGSRARRAR